MFTMMRKLQRRKRIKSLISNVKVPPESEVSDHVGDPCCKLPTVTRFTNLPARDGQYYDNARTTRLKSDKDSVGGCSQVSVVIFLVLLHARLWWGLFEFVELKEDFYEDDFDLLIWRKILKSIWTYGSGSLQSVSSKMAFNVPSQPGEHYR